MVVVGCCVVVFPRLFLGPLFYLDTIWVFASVFVFCYVALGFLWCICMFWPSHWEKSCRLTLLTPSKGRQEGDKDRPRNSGKEGRPAMPKGKGERTEGRRGGGREGVHSRQHMPAATKIP